MGILCSHVMVAFRPRMVEAVKMLEGEAEIPEIPDRPLPLMQHAGPLTVTDDCSVSSVISVISGFS